MIRLLTPLLVALWAHMGHTQPFPALFDVVGVASDDFLNIREEPSANSAKIGTLDHDQTNVEVIDLDPSEKWALVTSGESMGWVAIRYLKQSPVSDWLFDDIKLACSGTEPFWSAELSADKRRMSFQFFDDPIENFEVDWTARPENFTGGVMGLAATGVENTIFSTISIERCNDGMSDREFGLGINLFVVNYGVPTGYRGCCSLSAD